MSAAKVRGRRVAQPWRETDEHLQLLLDNIKDYAMFVVDREGLIASWNVGVARILGYAEEDFVGQPFALIFPPEDAASGIPDAEMRQAAAEGRREEERWHMRKDGTRFWASGVLTALRDDLNQIRGFAKIMRDMTERKLAEEERAALLVREQQALQEAQRANGVRDEFLAMLSHELRAPLNAIAGWVTLLQSGHADEGTLRRGLEVIGRNARKQTQIVNELFEFRQIVSGDLTLDLEPVDLGRIVAAVVSRLAPEAHDRSIALETSAPFPCLVVAGDSSRLAQVLFHLLTNALKFTPAGGSVGITLTASDGCAALTVSDTGVGIGADILPHVFEPFRQADSTSRRSFGGLGLGLALVKELVARHGGTITVHSEGAKRGTVFTVRLPLVAAETDAMPAPEPDLAVSLSGLHVLVIDDDHEAREPLASALQLAGASVRVAASSNEGIERLTDPLPDVIICDIGMPHEDGYDFAVRLRALPEVRGGQIPAIALTAYTDAEDVRKILTSGFQSHIAKPPDLSSLFETIASLCGRP